MSGATPHTILCVLPDQGTLTVGDTVLFLTMMAQLYGPLNFFGTYYRVIQQYMIDMENLLQLLDTPGRVTDAPGAKDLVLSKGEVVFDDVSFAYQPGYNVLKGVSVCVHVCFCWHMMDVFVEMLRGNIGYATLAYILPFLYTRMLHTRR